MSKLMSKLIPLAMSKEGVMRGYSRNRMAGIHVPIIHKVCIYVCIYNHTPR